MNQKDVHLQGQFNSLNRELKQLQIRWQALQNQQTRLQMLEQFRQHGVICPRYIGFQPVSRSL